MSHPKHPARSSRLPLAISLLLIGGCAFTAYWVTASPFDVPPSPAATEAPAPIRRAAFGGRADVPLSPLGSAGVDALGGVRATTAKDWLTVTLPPTLPPPVRIPAVPITIPLRPGIFASYEGTYELPFEAELEAALADDAVPLLWIAGDEDAMLTPGFRVADFASRDGAALARISYRLVEGLERLRQEAGSLAIISGYRNAAHNAAVGGVAHSEHLEGRAADVWSADHPPLGLARLALQTLGCGLGLGLGPRTLHIDVRGELVTWTYPGAAMPNAAFDAWALAQCGRPVPPELAQEAAEAWLTDAPGTADSLYADASATDLLARFHTDALEAARAGYALEGPGAVVLDFRAGVPPGRYLPPSYLRYVVAGSVEATELGLGELIGWRERGRQHAYFVYAVLLPSAPPAVGVSSFAAQRAAPEPAPAPSPLASADAPDPTTPWTIVVASHVRAARADASLARYRPALREAGLAPAIAYDDGAERYRVTAGRFATPDAAQRTLDALAAALPDDAWVHRL